MRIRTKLRLPRSIARFRANESGATAVEFAFVAVPFFGIIFAILQTAVIMFAQQALQTITANASRHIMTGELDTSSTLADFKERLCGDLSGSGSAIFDCANVLVEVRSFTDFSTALPGIDEDSCFDSATMADPDEAQQASCYDVGGPSQVVIVRTQYVWPFSINPETLDLKSKLNAVSAFRNEPYQ